MLGGDTDSLYNTRGLQRAVCDLEQAKALILKHYMGPPPGVINQHMYDRVLSAYDDIYRAELCAQASTENLVESRKRLSDWMDEYRKSKGRSL